MNSDLGGFYPDSTTSTTMHVMKRRILHFAKTENRLPDSVDELPVIQGFNNRENDAWGNRIRMKVTGTEVSLISYGKDNKPGGTDSDLDFIAVFDSKNPSGEWANENDDGNDSWKEKQELRRDKAEYE